MQHLLLRRWEWNTAVDRATDRYGCCRLVDPCSFNIVDLSYCDSLRTDLLCQVPTHSWFKEPLEESATLKLTLHVSIPHPRLSLCAAKDNASCKYLPTWTNQLCSHRKRLTTSQISQVWRHLRPMQNDPPCHGCLASQKLCTGHSLLCGHADSGGLGGIVNRTVGLQAGQV